MLQTRWEKMLDSIADHKICSPDKKKSNSEAISAEKQACLVSPVSHFSRFSPTCSSALLALAFVAGPPLSYPLLLLHYTERVLLGCDLCNPGPSHLEICCVKEQHWSQSMPRVGTMCTCMWCCAVFLSASQAYVVWPSV